MLITEESVVRPSTSAHPNAAPKMRWAPWLWLGVGGALLPFTIFAHVVPIATWLAPVFLMRFVRTTRAAISLPIIGMLGYLAVLLVLWDIVPTPGLYVFALPAGLTVIFTYGADRLLARRIGGVLGTLVFPATDTALNFLPGVISREAFAVGAAAYTQASELSLIQLVSVTGLWGLNFLIAWLAPVANDLWEKGFNVRQVWRGVAVFLGVLTAVLLFGGARLAFSPPTATTVRVAALAPDRDLNEAVNDAPLAPRPLPAATRAAIRQRYLDPLAEDLFARTTQAARGGAKIVVWSEAAAFAFKEDEASFLERAQSVARQEHIYLQIGLVFLLPTDRYPMIEIRAIMIDPNGSVSWDYPKATEVFTDGNQPGPWRVPTLDTPYGRLATVICYDADFPQLVRQAGKAGTDILLVPSSDWPPIAEPHSRMAIFRAVENGVALVRPTRLGTSIASDHQGRLLGYKSDYFVGSDHTMIVNVPTSGGTTLYVLVGESVGWLCVVGMLGLAGFAGVRKIQSKGAGAALN
jgi:apolipoprotein N-acyltransferase